MFALYGISGPIFQGTLEALSKIPPVTRRSRVGAIRGLGEESAIEAQTARLSTSGTGRRALDAYQSMLPETLERGPLYVAQQIMSAQVIWLNLDEDVAGAWKTLVDHQIHQAPVLDSARRLVGIVSERNLLTAFNVDGGEVRDVLLKRVRDVMSTPVVAAAPTTDIRRIAHVMLERNVDGVPITDETGALIGFVSRTDILRAVVTDPPLSTWQ